LIHTSTCPKRAERLIADPIDIGATRDAGGDDLGGRTDFRGKRVTNIHKNDANVLKVQSKQG
jgi:hypothetical protein